MSSPISTWEQVYHQLPPIFQTHYHMETLPKFNNRNYNSKSKDRLPIFWYASAGQDCRPFTYLHPQFHQKRGVQLPNVKLLVYTCLPYDRRTYGPSGVRWRDKNTEISCVRRERLFLDRSIINYKIDRRFARFGEDPMGPEATYAEYLIQSTEGEPRYYNVLFLHMENNNFFSQVLKRGFFDLKILCAIREGLGMGGCGKSVLTTLYHDGEVKHLIKKGIDPKFVINWDTGINNQFCQDSRRFYQTREVIDNYIVEQLGAGSNELVHQLG